MYSDVNHQHDLANLGSMNTYIFPSELSNSIKYRTIYFIVFRSNPLLKQNNLTMTLTIQTSMTHRRVPL